MEVVLKAEDWDKPPPNCPSCIAWDLQEQMRQEFKPPAIGGSIAARAAAITESIIANDYGVADFRPDNREGGVAKVLYKDQGPNVMPAAWQNAQGMLAQAIDVGRAQRHVHYDKGPQGNGLDVLKGALASGEQPDLIAA